MWLWDSLERKGLPLLLQALGTAGMEPVKLIVVRGEPDLIALYREEAEKLHLGNRVKFVGMQSDVRPYLWSADVFVFPSLYETFSSVTYEAAAAGLPIVVSQLYGVEDLLVDRDNGFLIETTAAGVKEGLERVLSLTWLNGTSWVNEPGRRLPQALRSSSWTRGGPFIFA